MFISFQAVDVHIAEVLSFLESLLR